MAKNFPFPIKTDTACLLKWTWCAFWVSRGKLAICHRNYKIDIPVDDFDNFFNQPYYLDHRRSMLRGEWPNSPNHLGCKFCKKIEDAGGLSDRLYMTSTQTDQTPDELIDDPTAIHVTPKVIEIFLSKTCNLACTYCNTFNSSKIEAETIKYSQQKEFNDFYFGGNHDGGLENNKNKSIENNNDISPEKIKLYEDLLLSWLERKGQSLRRLHVLGGEPFYNPRFLDFVKVWKKNPNPDLILNVVSNTSVMPKTFKKQVDLIGNLIEEGCIEDFELSASLDCWGPQLEYVRSGANCDVIEENILYYLNLPTTKYLNINATHSLMSIPYYYKLVEKKSEWEDKTGKPIRMFGDFVISSHVNAKTLGGEFYKDAIKNFLKSYNQKHWDDEQIIKSFLSHMKSIKDTKPNLEKIKHFVTVYDELDRRRRTNWREVFPEIAAEIEKYKDDLV